MTMKLAFSRPTGTADERSTLFNQYKSIGYDGLQLKYSQYAPYLDQPDRFVEEWGQFDGLASALITGGTLDEQNIDQLRKIITFSQKIGTELIVFCHSLPRNAVTVEDIRTFAVILSQLGKEAAQAGIKLSLHHHFNQPVMYREDFDVFFDKVEDQSVGLTIDTAHLIKSGITDIQGIILSFRSCIDNFHLKDFAHGDWKVLGKGNINFPPIFRAIRDIDYKGWVSADEESGSGVIEGMSDCLSFMKKGLFSEK
jgi:inosose dehydratase